MLSNNVGGFSEGTGYGGAGGGDKKKLLEGRKKAAQQETANRLESIQYLKELQDTFRTKFDEAAFVIRDGSRLVRVLQELFRNQVPKDWAALRVLYLTALDVCESLAASDTLGALLIRVVDDLEPSETAQIEIEESDDDTLLSLLTQFADLAACVQQSSQATATEKKFVSRVIKVKKQVEATATRVKSQTNKNAPIVSIMTQQDIYKKELGPLRFDLCQSLSHHMYSKGAMKQSAARARALFKELTSYKTALPIEYGSSIFVRAVEDRLDSIRALILGPDETPYANGAFIFDISLPSNYPQKSPTIHFVNHGGKRFNPNLYDTGKVCLSLLGTWEGPGWVSGQSTLLQVLISIQSLILVPDPYFNEPGYEASRGTAGGTAKSNAYNQTIEQYTLSISLAPILASLAQGKPSPYPEFDDVFRKHFLCKRVALERQLGKWVQTNASVRAMVPTVLGHLQTFGDVHKSAKRKRVPSFKVLSNGVIDLLGGSTPSKRILVAADTAKTPSPNEVVSLLDEDSNRDDQDSKMPAVSSKPDGGVDSDVVDLSSDVF